MVQSLPRRDLGGGPPLLGLVAQVALPLPHRDRHVDGSEQGVEAHLPVPVVHDGADVASLQPVGPHRVQDGLGDGLRRIRHLHLIQVGGTKKPPNVVRKPEDRGPARGAIRADAFEYTGPVVQGVGEDVDMRVSPVHELPVHPNLLDRLDRHGSPPSPPQAHAQLLAWLPRPTGYPRRMGAARKRRLRPGYRDAAWRTGRPASLTRVTRGFRGSEFSITTSAAWSGSASRRYSRLAGR